MAILYFTIDRDTHHLLPPSIQDYLPEDHPARLVVEITDWQRGAACFNFSSAHAGGSDAGISAVRCRNLLITFTMKQAVARIATKHAMLLIASNSLLPPGTFR